MRALRRASSTCHAVSSAPAAITPRFSALRDSVARSTATSRWPQTSAPIGRSSLLRRSGTANSEPTTPSSVVPPNTASSPRTSARASTNTCGRPSVQTSPAIDSGWTTSDSNAAPSAIASAVAARTLPVAVRGSQRISTAHSAPTTVSASATRVASSSSGSRVACSVPAVRMRPRRRKFCRATSARVRTREYHVWIIRACEGNHSRTDSRETPALSSKCRLNAPGNPAASSGATASRGGPSVRSKPSVRCRAVHSTNVRSAAVITGIDAIEVLDRASSALDATGIATPPVSSSSAQSTTASAPRCLLISRSASASIRWSSRSASSGSGISSGRNAARSDSCECSRLNGPVIRRDLRTVAWAPRADALLSTRASAIVPAAPIPTPSTTHASVASIRGYGRSRIRAAATAAPNPLSMLHTVTPAAQELSIVRSGASPPNAAP